MGLAFSRLPPLPCAVHVLSENDKGPDGKAVLVWFALAEDRPLAFFAGVWTTWTSTRNLAEARSRLTCSGF